MSERDELINEGRSLHNAWFDGPDMERTDRMIRMANVAREIHQPRTITTAEELDALGLGATVLDGLGDVWTNDGDSEDQWGSVTAKEDFGGPQWYGSSNMHLPATVLYEPTS